MLLPATRPASSLKVSGGWPDDSADDVAGAAWAGVLPFHARVGDPRPAPDLRPGIPVPASVRAIALRCPQRSGTGRPQSGAQ